MPVVINEVEVLEPPRPAPTSTPPAPATPSPAPGAHQLRQLLRELSDKHARLVAD